jgi:transposase
MYNRLFNYLDTITTSLDDDLSGQGDEWPTVVKAVVEKGKQKLSKYYRRTDKERGFLFNCATILDLRQKLTAYKVLLLQRFITDIC